MEGKQFGVVPNSEMLDGITATLDDGVSHQSARGSFHDEASTPRPCSSELLVAQSQIRSSWIGATCPCSLLGLASADETSLTPIQVRVLCRFKEREGTSRVLAIAGIEHELRRLRRVEGRLKQATTYPMGPCWGGVLSTDGFHTSGKWVSRSTQP
ncbi:hypothetical protein JHW43_003225 [Diplocarpon mali]|nr:hypothetical protein JHW43_003225 [Diplocarpon mali]